MHSGHLLCMDPLMVRSVSVYDHVDRDDLVLGLPQFQRPSFPARGVQAHHDPDDRALPDRLRPLHRHLDGHQVAPVPGE